MDLKAILKQLTEKGYVLSAGKGKYSFSMKFYDELKMQELVEQGSKPPINMDLQVIPITKELREFGKLVDGMTYSQLFIQFIQDANVPAKSEDGRGNLYAVNKYNDKAAVVLYKLVTKEGIDYALLCKSTALYYNGGKNRMKKLIGNYIIDGDWRTDYLVMQEKVSEGAEALKEHIKQEKDNGGNGNYGYTLG